MFNPDFALAFVVTENLGYVYDLAPYVPSVYLFTNEDGTTDEEIDSDKWEFVSGGMTGQYGYNGPVLHPSEHFSEGMVERLLELHTDYDVFGCQEVINPDEPDELIGWVILGHKRSVSVCETNF